MQSARKKVWVAAVVCSSGLMFQSLPAGCNEYFANFALQSLDFCTVFNCSGSSFFDFCNPVPLFADCPNTGDAES